MILLPPDLREKLLANGADRGPDHVPVLKLFNPCGAATWLASELYGDGDTLFGLADLGFGCPEIGVFSLTDIASIRLSYGLGIEQDLHFSAHSASPSMPTPRASRDASLKPRLFFRPPHRRDSLAENPGFRPHRTDEPRRSFGVNPGCTRHPCKTNGCSRSTPEGMNHHATRKYRPWQAVRQQDQHAPRRRRPGRVRHSPHREGAQRDRAADRSPGLFRRKAAAWSRSVRP